MSALLVIFVSTIIAVSNARRCDLNNPCEAMICQDVRRSCYSNFDVMCECEMYDECEGPFMAQYLPRTRPAACSGGYYPPYYPPNPRPPINPSPPVNPPPVNPPPVNPPPINPPPANPGSNPPAIRPAVRGADMSNPCEAMICYDVRRSCCSNYDIGCICESFDECEGRNAAYLPNPVPPQCYGYL